MTESRQQAQLLLDEGALQRRIELLRLPFTIGRLPDRDLILPDSHISRRHAQIVEEEGRFLLIDEGSQSGSYVNGWRVQRQVLRDGDLIQIGSVDAPHIRFHLQDQTSMTSLRELLQQIPDTSGSESNLAKLGWFVEAARRLNDCSSPAPSAVSSFSATASTSLSLPWDEIPGANRSRMTKPSPAARSIRPFKASPSLS
jgi:pSer/pThr/pTyr-binding forkhead associated (FHA) protein